MKGDDDVLDEDEVNLYNKQEKANYDSIDELDFCKLWI